MYVGCTSYGSHVVIDNFHELDLVSHSYKIEVKESFVLYVHLLMHVLNLLELCIESHC